MKSECNYRVNICLRVKQIVEEQKCHPVLANILMCVVKLCLLREQG
jgi:hypothetical protein